jgi:predicted lipoprotein with Yx(FWY)xxD motif
MKRFAATALAMAGVVSACGSSQAMTIAPANSGSATKIARASSGSGTKIVVGKSQFGTMLFNSKRQAIYVFSADARRKSNCYGECARLWPPVYTSAKPRAGAGLNPSLLGTIKRRGGRVQVTYAGRPLYYYVHEGPGQVRCHNVNLNGGIWKVVAPNGRSRR